MHELEQLIDTAWEDRANLKPGTAPARIGEAVNHIIGELDNGKLRVAEKINGDWVTHQWINKAVLLSFRLDDNVQREGGPLRRRRDRTTGKFKPQPGSGEYGSRSTKRGPTRDVVPAPLNELPCTVHAARGAGPPSPAGFPGRTRPRCGRSRRRCPRRRFQGSRAFPVLMPTRRRQGAATPGTVDSLRP